MTEEKPKWTVERVHQEISEARTKIFVRNQVSGNREFKVLRIAGMGARYQTSAQDMIANAEKIQQVLGEEEGPA